MVSDLATIVAFSSLALVACSNETENADKPDGSAVDSGTPDGSASDVQTTSDAATSGCGSPPYIRFSGRVTSYVNPTVGVEGARITADLCPGVTFTSDRNGDISGQVQKGAAFNPRGEADGFVTMRLGEERLLADFQSAVPMYPTSMAALAPDLSDQSPAILVLTTFKAPPVDAGSDPCATKDGYVFSVQDHPEAHVVYYGGTTSPVPDPTLTSTGPLGAAEIGGLQGGSVVELVATKAGCDVGSFVSYPHTGKYTLENGVLTVAGYAVPPVPTP